MRQRTRRCRLLGSRQSYGEVRRELYAGLCKVPERLMERGVTQGRTETKCIVECVDNMSDVHLLLCCLPPAFFPRWHGWKQLLFCAWLHWHSMYNPTLHWLRT